MEALLVLGDDPSLREGVKDLIRIGKFKISKFYSVNVLSKFTFLRFENSKNIDF